MKSRRNFITKAGIATAGLIALKPFNSIASSSIARKLGLSSNTKLVLLHTSPHVKYSGHANQTITALQNSRHSMLLLKQEGEPVQEPQFEIVYRGQVKAGIIKAAENSSLAAINDIAASLKQNDRCDMVICLSSLGYKKENHKDDLTLAEKSSHIDFIIGNHAANHTPFAVVARNKERAEVIIHHAADNGFGLGNIEVEFDAATNAKRCIGINNLLTRLPENT
jgi:hypothetical protein